MLAWGPPLGLALLAAAPVFTGGKLPTAIRLAMTVGGTLSVVGVLGPAIGDLRFWLPAMAGYAGVLPVIGCLLVIYFGAAGTDVSNAR
jgi:hypothetical protein